MVTKMIKWKYYHQNMVDIRTIKHKLNDIEKTLAVNIEARDRNLLLTLSESYGTLSKLYRKLISKICKKDLPTITVGQQNHIMGVF